MSQVIEEAMSLIENRIGELEEQRGRLESALAALDGDKGVTLVDVEKPKARRPRSKRKKMKPVTGMILRLMEKNPKTAYSSSLLVAGLPIDKSRTLNRELTKLSKQGKLKLVRRVRHKGKAVPTSYYMLKEHASSRRGPIPVEVEA